MTDLAAIIERDRGWIEQDGRLVYTWINVRSGETRVAEHATDPDGPADRRALLALLRETREAAREYLAHDGSGLRLDADNPWRGDWDAVKNYDNLRALRVALSALAEP